MDQPLWAEDSTEEPWHVEAFLELFEDPEEIEEVPEEELATVTDMAAWAAMANAAMGGGAE